MKRFYKMVSVATVPEGFAIHLDGKPVRTPSEHGLIAPTKALADLVAAEWEVQEEKIDPETMPLTQIVTTAREHVAIAREEMTRLVLAYLDTDLLCYRAPEPEALAQRQAQIWDRRLEWFAGRFGAELKTTTALTALEQSEVAQRAVANYIAALDLWRFSVLQTCTAISGSIVLALAFTEKEAMPEEILEEIYVEERYRGEIYNEALHGMDPHQEKVMTGKMRDLLALRQILETVSET